MKNLLKPCLLVFTLFVFAVLNPSFAQHKRKGHRSTTDSLRRVMLKRDSLFRTFKQSDNSINSLLQKVEYYNSAYIQDFSDLSQGFDTLEESEKLPPMEKRMVTMGNLIQNDHSSPLSYLFTIREIVGHFKDDLARWQTDLAEDNSKLDKILNDADEFRLDTAMHTIPADSGLRVKYLEQTSSIQKKWGSLDVAVKKDLVKIGLLQNRVTALDLLIFDINDRIDIKIKEFTVKASGNEYGALWEKPKQNLTPFDTVTAKTWRLNSKLLSYFIDLRTTNHINITSHIASILVFAAFFIWIHVSRRKLAKSRDDYEDTFKQTNFVVGHSFVSALTLACVMALYFYDQPPFVFVEIIFLLIMICIGVLIKSAWPKPLFYFWIALFGLTVLYSITNLFTRVSEADRVILLVLSLMSIAAGLVFLLATKNSTENYPPYTRPRIILFSSLHGISLILNIFGRFSLAKILGVATIFNIDLGFGFYLLIQIIMESLFLQLEANKTTKYSMSSYVDFNILQNNFKNVLVKIAVVLWLVKFLENLYVSDYLFTKIGEFLIHPFKLGTNTFTFGSLVIFVFVLWLSIIIARIISYFYDFAEQQSALNDVKKTRTSILLIRLGVFSLGFIAAITLSGIPLSEVTIVIGSLGVGIGFGLQNIVNNLVSGVILAFEKPIQVGDIIEVGNRAGTIKEIGIRASKISAGNGSELIVPNGDLISQHVINWTLNNNNRQIELFVGVAYGSDVAKVDEILRTILTNRDDIMQAPAPVVFLHNFSESSVDFRLLFWAADINKWVSLKSKVMIEIYTEFAKQGIEIPHPKRDIQVFFPEGTSYEVKKNEDTGEAHPGDGHIKLAPTK